MRIESTKLAGQPDPAERRDKELKKVCQDFEAVFIGQLLKNMRKTAVKADLFGSQKEEEMFRDMMDDEIAKTASRTNSIGIAEMLYNQLRGENR